MQKMSCAKDIHNWQSTTWSKCSR